jgi:hypothetical protein
MSNVCGPQLLRYQICQCKDAHGLGAVYLWIPSCALGEGSTWSHGRSKHVDYVSAVLGVVSNCVRAVERQAQQVLELQSRGACIWTPGRGG